MARRFWISGVLAVVALSLAFGQTVKRAPAPYTSPDSGKQMYKAYCASCHGLDGKGTGPAATAMKSPVPDLTQLSKKNGGQYPADHVTAEIRGDTNNSSHGSAEMPVWGPVFLKVSGSSAGQVQLRVKNLTTYIQSMQEK
jgi:mono/diheme cytochrome c family protein